MDEEIKPMASLETAPPPLNTEEPLGEGVEGLRDEQEMEEELLNPPQSSDAQEKEQQAQMASEEKAKLEQIVFNQTQELDQLRLQMKSISSRNQELTNQIANSTAEIASKDNKYRLMETSRDDTAFKKIQSDEVAEKYKREKEERDTLVRSITREKNMLNEEIVSVKERLKNVNTEKMELVAEKKAWDREKRENQCELQRVRDEIAVLRESKKWLLSEINERDNKVSQLRIDASNKEIVWQNEKNNFSTKADFLNERIVELEAELKNAEATAAEQTKEFRKALDVQEKRVFEADYELTLREKITQDYKDALNEAEGVIAELKANCQRYESSIGELHEDMKNLREVVQKKEEDYENELKERSTQIAELQDELEKANELLKSRYSVGAATDEELQKIAPAAAAASQLIRSGMTLSQLYREYARVIGELEEQKVLNLQLDNEMSTIVEEIEKNAPNWKRQKEQLDRSLTHNDHLTEQLEKAADERMSLLQQKDSALRELSFTKMELERFQREHTKLREQTTHLLFVIESEARTSNGGPPLGADEQRRMYTSITGLQQKNIQLQMELENVQRDSQKRVEDAVRIESVRLREELETSKKEHENLQVAMNHLKTVMASLEQQRDRLRDLVEKGSLDPEAAQLRKENEDMKLELTSIKARYQLLENRLKELQEASTTQQRIADDRIAQHNGRFNELQVSRASLEAELEMQRQIATETKREFDKFMQSFYKKGEEAQKARSALVEIEKKLLSNNEMVLQQQNRIASLEVANRVLSEDTDHARSTIARLEGELKVHQEMAKTHETLISVLGDAERRLQLGEDLKITRLESLLESTTIERDQLRVTNQNLSDQLTHASRLSSEAEKRLSGERDHLMAKLNETQAANKEIEDEMVNLRAKLDVAQKQAALYESSNVAHNPERLANRNTYLETQVEELRVQLAESDAKLKRREQELAQLSTTSDSVEASLRQHTENSSQTISQLNSLLRKAEQRNVELTSDLAVARDELQRESENFTAREAQWNNDKTTLEQRIAIIEVQLANSESVKEDTQRRLNEARSENTQDKEKVNELEQNINQLQIDRDGLEVNLEGLRTQLSHTTIELQNANARVVEEARAREAAVDAEKTRQKDAEEKIRRAEENLLVAQSRTEELVQHIANLSNELSVREAQLSGQATEGVGVISEGSVQSLHQVLRFLREEKEKAQERLMQAEIDEKRKAIESEELRVEKNRIAETLRQREAEAEQNKAALAQRSELITRLQKMASIAKENTMLKGEKEKLTTAYSQLNNKAITLDRQVAQLQEDKAKAEQNAASATALAEARQAELEVSRKKIGETAQQKINNMMKAVEEARARAEKFVAEKDAETLKVQEVVQQAAGKDKTIKTLELKVKDTENRHQQVVALAKSLRDQRDKLKQQVDGKTPIEPVQNESMQKKQEEIQQLQEQVNDLTQKLEAEVAKAKALHEQAEEEKNEASFRSTAMSNMVKKTQDRLTSLTKELEAEKEAHARTRAEAALQQAAVQPSSSHPVELPPAPTPVISQSSVIVPSVPTPTSASGTTSTVQHMTETVPHVPSSSVTRQTDAHPTVPSAQQSIFSPFSNQPSTFRTTPSSAVFGSTTLFQAQTSSNLLPTSSSTVTVSAPQSSSPTPSVPMVASFFGTRPATIPNRGSSSFTFASSAAPADPAPAISTFSSFATTTTTKPVISIGESSHLSATQPQPDSRAQEESSVVLVEEDLLPPTDGVSQDGLLSAITSSSGEGVGGRKRTATGNETDNEAKRQRESPGEEQITSSERLHDEAEVLLDEDVSNEALEEIPGEDEDLGDHDDEDLEGLEEEGEIGEMEEGNDDGLPEVIDNFEDDDDDIQEVPDHPLQHQRMQRQGTPSDDDIQVLSSDTDEGDGATDSEDDQGIGRMDEEQGDEEEAEDFDYGEGAEDLDDEEAAVDFVDDDGEAEVIQGIDQSDHDAGGDVDEQTQDAENVGDDLGDLGEEREAASAMEEADDEREDGEKSMRAAEDEGIAGEEESDTYSQPSQSSSTATSHAGRQAQMRRAVRTPISYDLVPTSSNESTEPQSSSSGVAAAQRRQRPPMSAGLYVTPMNRQQTAHRGGMISGRGQPQMARRGGAPGLAQRARRGGGRGI